MHERAHAGGRPSEGVAGFLQQLSGIFAAGAEYLRVRLQLAGLEAKEAAVHYAIIVALAILALIVIVFGYFFFCLGLVFGIAALIGGKFTWIWVTFGMALLHFGAAGVALLYARAKLAEPMFAATLNEFKKDHAWLNPAKRSN